MLRNPSDTLLDSKLKTQFLVGRVRHTKYVQSNSSRKRIQVKEVWHTEKELGRGSYGVVWLQSRRPTSTSELELPMPYRLRAVKEIRKTAIGGITWDYLKELETIAKFSHPCYAGCFVRTYGWYESPECVFITMEYFELGDLQKFMRERPPFSEHETAQIVQQLLEGAEFMHEKGFAHRDIKPGNILVESPGPQWSVKIADFGISKRAQDGETDFRTHVGTSAYMAPEVLGLGRDRNGNRLPPYSVAVDIWAIGIITVELLLKRVLFSSLGDIADYCYNREPINLDGANDVNISSTCRDFVGKLLLSDPSARPTAGATKNHPWLAAELQLIEEQEDIIDEEESLFVENTTHDISLAVRNAPTTASLAWSDPTATKTLGTLQNTYRGPQFDTNLLIDSFRGLQLETTRYFVLRSNNELDVETSVAHGIWTSTKVVNTKLANGFSRANGRVVLFFSVVKSRKFCGVARMTSPIDWHNTDPHWQDDDWQG
ncbi:Pkinase-domain-containing protein [Hyaloscypha variabilis F]|uniref:Autophagy-related protein 1 n=1 Tax=Hyaloscypha variabilis (strain UAMH 11265 / GT02V1 / F) TaxID=1149755 RepID=A0A2J6RLW4_HYAVF|nr:Pkinase-domain-containing protein [Hyaloscypha variabilis F]